MDVFFSFLCILSGKKKEEEEEGLKSCKDWFFCLEFSINVQPRFYGWRVFAEDMVALSGSRSMSLLPATIYSEAAVCVWFKATWWRLMFVNSVTEEETLIVKLSGTRWWRGGKQREKRWPMQIDGLSQPMAQLSHLQHLIVPPHTHPTPTLVISVFT